MCLTVPRATERGATTAGRSRRVEDSSVPWYRAAELTPSWEFVFLLLVLSGTFLGAFLFARWWAEESYARFRW